MQIIQGDLSYSYIVSFLIIRQSKREYYLLIKVDGTFQPWTVRYIQFIFILVVANNLAACSNLTKPPLTCSLTKRILKSKIP